MNKSTPTPGDDLSKSAIPTAMPPARPVRKKRRWWVYALAGLGGLFVLAILAVVLLVGYWHSLIRNYTTTQAVPLPRLTASVQGIDDLKLRWAGFWQAVLDDNARDPFKLSAEDLNVVIANIPNLQDRFCLDITNNQILGHFSVPLDQSNKKELKGRFLNGTARLKLTFDDGWLTASVLDLKANGKPVPGWILKKVQKENILKDLDKNQEAIAFLHKLHNVEVKEGFVILTP